MGRENFDIKKWYPDGKLPAFYSEREGMKGWNLFQLMHRKARGDDVGNSTFGGKNYCAESNGNAADTLMLCAWVAQTDLSEFFKKWNPGANAYQLPGAAEMSFEGGVSQSAYNTLASLLPKPEQGRKPLIRLPNIRCLLNNRIRRSRRIRHDIRRIGSTHMPDASVYRARRKATWHTPAGPHPASYNKQPLTMLLMFFSNTRGDAHTGNRRRIDHRQF